MNINRDEKKINKYQRWNERQDVTELGWERKKWNEIQEKEAIKRKEKTEMTGLEREKNKGGCSKRKLWVEKETGKKAWMEIENGTEMEKEPD